MREVTAAGETIIFDSNMSGGAPDALDDSPDVGAASVEELVLLDLVDPPNFFFAVPAPTTPFAGSLAFEASDHKLAELEAVYSASPKFLQTTLDATLTEKESTSMNNAKRAEFMSNIVVELTMMHRHQVADEPDKKIKE